MSLNITKIKNILSSEKKLHAWKIANIDLKKVSSFLTKNDELETTIDSTRNQAEITIYVRQGKKLGESSFTIFSENDLIENLKDQIILAKLAKNDYYELPDKKLAKKQFLKRADEKIISSFKNNSIPKKANNYLKKLSQAVIKEKKIKLSSAEIIVSLKERTILNSNDLKQKDLTTSVYVEAVLTSYDKKLTKEQEYLASKKVVRFSDLKISDFVKENSIIARDILIAENMQGIINDNIVLRGEALREYFVPNLGLNPLIFHCSAKIKHMKLSVFNLDEQVTQSNLTIKSNPLLAYNVSSSSFDKDGVSSKPLVLIEKGVFKNYFASKQYADYMGVAATGELGVIEISKGNNSESELEKISVVEIVAFSSFTPNSVSGDFSAEIRLAYLYKNGKKIPVRAAMFSGNIFRVQHHLSSKIVEDQGYKGPSKLLLKGATLTGF